MAIVEIPLQAVPSQSVAVALAGQACVIYLRQIGGRQYISVSSGAIPVCDNVLVVNKSAIIRAGYTGFIGDLMAIDTVGDDAPVYTGWGARWHLVYNPEA